MTDTTIFGRHQKIALAFSGGKDSTACVYMYRDHLDKITVYWVNTGDLTNETLEVVNKVRDMCPNFVEIQSDIVAWQSRNGIPSDIVPAESVAYEMIYPITDMKLVSSVACCFHNIMQPLHRQIEKDGNTCEIHGQKLSDVHRGMLRNGDKFNGIELVYPLEDMDDDLVIDYLRSVGAPVNDCYLTGNHGVDCKHCTGWWDHHHEHFLKGRYPNEYEYVEKQRNIIKVMLMKRLSEC